MKKPSPTLWERQARIARYRAAERFSKGRRTGSFKLARFVEPGQVISAPIKFSLVQGEEVAVAKFLRAVANRVLRDRKPVILDFRMTESFFVSGTILLLAEINRIVALSEQQKPVTIREPRRRKPREVLKQIGMYALTGDSSDIVPERDDVVYWKATRGADQSGDKLKILEAVTQKANQAHARQLQLSELWRGVSEAVANAVDHGYKVPRSDGFSGLPDAKWWMFTQLRDGFFSVAVCDLGCGYRSTIGLTLPETFVTEIGAILGGWSRDARAIETAMRYGRTGTKQSERGKGSRDALSVLQKHGEGEMLIVSNAGWVRYVYADGHESRKDHGELRIDIRGTIIWWRLPLKEVEI